MIVPVGTPITDVYDKFGSLVPTQQFLDSYEAGDLRAAERGMFFSEYPNVDNGTTIETFSTALYKYFDVDAVTTGKCDLNFTLYRLPEVMLIYAESYTPHTVYHRLLYYPDSAYKLFLPPDRSSARL